MSVLRSLIPLFFASIAFAQLASVTGRITDPSGAVVPGASVTARSSATGVTATTESTSDGYYTLPALQPGQYEITINKQGFVPVKQTGLELAVQQVARIDITLKIGQIAETIASRAPIAAETAKLNLHAAYSMPLEQAIVYAESGS